MAVYVDPIFECGRRPGWPWPTACHMYADTPDELHALAAAIGLKRVWCSDHTQPGSSVLHYDLNARRREAALALGVLEADRKHILGFRRSLEVRMVEADARKKRKRP